MIWANPEWFWALLVLPVLIGIYLFRHFARRSAGLTISGINGDGEIPSNFKSRLHWLVAAANWAAVALLIIAMARPQKALTTVERNAEGIDIVLVIDLSTSMLAEDLKPNRFEAVREVAKSFVDRRISDRIGLVAFAYYSYTVVPPTLDYKLLKDLINDLKMGTVQDGTAIGMGLATAINRLKDSEAESRVIILLTDGQNNAGEIDPVTAADLAYAYGIKIYAVGAGTRGTAPYPVQDPIFGLRYQNIEVDIDDDMLIAITELTGGRYYRATNTEELQKIYEEIDTYEKTEIEEIIYTDYKDLYLTYLLISFALFAAALAVDRLYLRTVVHS